MHNLSLDAVLPAENAQVPAARSKRGATRAPGLKTGQDNRVSPVAAETDQMVQDAPARQHSACGDDDHRSLPGIELLRLLDRVHALCQTEHVHAVFPAYVMLCVVAVIDVGGVNGHWAVQIHRDVGDFFAPYQPSDVIHEPLCPADGKGWDQNRAATREHPLQHWGKFGLGVDIGVFPVSICRLADKHVRAAVWLGRPHQRIGVMS